MTGWLAKGKIDLWHCLAMRGFPLLLATLLLSVGQGVALGKEGAGDRFSVQAVNAPLAAVLHRLADQAAVPLVLYPEAKELVNLSVDDQALDALLKGLLREYNFVLHYHDAHVGTVSKIFVLSRKTPAAEVAKGLAPVLKVTVNQALSPAKPQGAAPKPALVDGQGGRAQARGQGPAPTLAKPVDAPRSQAGGGDGRFVTISRAGAASFNGVFSSPNDQLESAPLSLDNRLGFFRADTTGQQAKGLKLVLLTPDSPLAALGLVEGDVVREVNGHEVQSMADLSQQLNETLGQGAASPLILGVERPDRGGDPSQASSSSTPQHIYVRFVP